MIILFDTNVIIDFLLDRDPFADSAGLLLTLIERGLITGTLCATTVTTIHYLATKALGRDESHSKIRDLLSLFEIASVNRTVIENAILSDFSDFEDAVIYQAAHHAGADAITTRDPKGFKQAKLPAYNPIELLKILTIIPGADNE